MHPLHRRAAFYAATFLVLVGSLLGATPAHAVAGALDPTFGQKGLLHLGDRAGYDIALAQPDGKLVVGFSSGTLHQYEISLVRLKRNGDRDVHFGRSGMASIRLSYLFRGSRFGDSGGLRQIAFQEDGKILAVGMGQSGVHPVIVVSRFTGWGAPDRSFGDRGSVVIRIASETKPGALAIQEDGKIVLAGTVTLVGAGGNPDPRPVLIRLDPHGSLDGTFGGGGIVLERSFGGYYSALVIQPDGRMVVAGDRGVARYLPDGQLDPSFGNAGLAYHVTFHPPKLALQEDGRIVWATRYQVLRFTGAGRFDRTFGVNGQLLWHELFEVEVASVAVEGEAIILVGGLQRATNHSEFACIRLQSNGTPDPAFGSQGLVTTRSGRYSVAGGVVIQPNRKIVLVGLSRGQLTLVRYLWE